MVVITAEPIAVASCWTALAHRIGEAGHVRGKLVLLVGSVATPAIGH
jgi:hypothetical protein